MNVRTDYKLSSLWDLAYRAHSFTSFSPERRANTIVIEYSKMLEEDLKELGENKGNYEAKFIDNLKSWLGAKSNCISSMITGGSNFPVRRAQKANERERSSYMKFSKWRVKYFEAVNRVPTKSPEEELLIAERNLEYRINFQEELKAIGAAVRKTKLDKDETAIHQIIKILEEQGFDPERCRYLEWRGGKYRIPSFYLTNNNAGIKREKQKLATMEARISRKESWEDIQFEGGYVTIEDDRVKIFHDERPEREIINEIKKSGFRWSPNWKCWCRKHTGNGIAAAKRLSFVKDATTQKSEA